MALRLGLPQASQPKLSIDPPAGTNSPECQVSRRGEVQIRRKLDTHVSDEQCDGKRCPAPDLVALRPNGAVAGMGPAVRRPSSVLSGALPALLLADLAGWVSLARDHASLLSPKSCGSSVVGWVSSGWSGVEAALLLHPPARLVAPWLVMVWAMMTPLLAEPVGHLWTFSPARLRAPFLAVFVASYGAIWLLAGFLLMGAALALEHLARVTVFPAPALAAAIALLWQASPLKQACLNNCHRLPWPLGTAPHSG